MKKYLFTFLFNATFCLAQSNSFISFPKDTEPILKPVEHQVDLSSRILEMNDTTRFGPNKKEGRTKKSIIQVVTNNLADFRYDYNKRLSEKEKSNKIRRNKNHKSLISGKFTVEFGILPDGSVCCCKPLESSLNDSILEISLLLRIYKLNFGPTEYKDDTTTTMVSYPFIFSQ